MITKSYISEVSKLGARGFEERFKPGTKGSRGAVSIPDKYSDQIHALSHGAAADVKLVFSASHIKNWNAGTLWEGSGVKKVRLVFDTLRDGMAALLPEQADAKGAGVYTLSQRKPHYQASITTTWTYINRVRPETGEVTFPFSFSEDRRIAYVDMSELPKRSD